MMNAVDFGDVNFCDALLGVGLIALLVFALRELWLDAVWRSQFRRWTEDDE